MNLLFANNATTTLASGINSSATTIVLATGNGAKFPNPDAGEGFFMTLEDAATQLTNEIVLCTSRATDVCTVVRGQQGSTAVSWNAGDLISQLVTKGDEEQFIQPDQLQSADWTACTATGTNSLTATLPSGLTALPDSLAFTLRAAAANTGTVTLTLTLGTTVLPAHPIVKNGGSGLNAGDIPAAGAPVELVWSAALGAYVMTNPASGTAGSIAGGIANQILYQTAPGTTGFLNVPTIAGSVLAFIGGIITWAAAAVTSFNGRSGAVMPATGDYTAAQVGAVPVTAFQAPNVLLANPMFYTLPNGAIHQAGHLSITPNSRRVIPFPKQYPNACVSVVVSCDSAAAAIRVELIDVATFAVTTNASNITWSSDGY